MSSASTRGRFEVYEGGAADAGPEPTALFAQPADDGMHLRHRWLTPDAGDVTITPATDWLTYVLAGEVLLGGEALHAGDGFFVPVGEPRVLRPGAAGAELLEFEVGEDT